MKHKLLLLFFFLSTVLFAQTNDRIEIEGKIIAKTNEVEGVTIFNRSSNRGTITNEKGEFVIRVALNDLVEISALQFKSRTIKIEENIIQNKSIKIFLIEEVNTLDEVIILPYNLSGDLVVDVEGVKLIEPIIFSFGDFSDYEFSDDYLSGVENIAINKGVYYNGFDVVKIANLFFKQKKKKSKNQLDEELVKSKELTDVYSHKLLSTTFNIPIERVEAFIVYVEKNGLTQDLLLEKNGMRLVGFLINKREAFLKS